MGKSRAGNTSETTASNLDLSLDWETVFGGSQAIKILTPSIMKPMSDATPIQTIPTSLHRNFKCLDDFETYTREYQTEYLTGSDDTWPGGMKGWPPDYIWSEGSIEDVYSGEGNFVLYSAETWRNLSSFSFLSFQALAGYPLNIDIFLTDENSVTSETVSTEAIPSVWSRMEVPLNFGNCDRTNIDYITFIPRGTPTSYLYMDDIYVIDARSVSDKLEWITTDITAMEYNRDSSVNYTQVAGHFGDSVYSTNPNRRRGRISFRTRTREADDDLLFVENASKRAERLFFRCMSEGYIIQPSDATIDVKDSIYGPQKVIDFNYMEGS